MNADAAAELGRIQGLAYGPARNAATEAVTRRIEAEGPETLLPKALLDLVEAYVFSDEGRQGYVPFARLIRLWDERPELFTGNDQYIFFWEFKWIAGNLACYPEFTLEQAESLLEDMASRYRLAGNSTSAPLMMRFQWAWQTGAADAEQRRRTWLANQHDELDDCAACVLGQQVEFFTEQGRFAEAIELGVTQTHSCNVEPTRTRANVALAALELGQPELAASAYRDAYAALVVQGRDLSTERGQLFEVQARGGLFDQALRRLRNDDVSLLRGAETPLSHLGFLIRVLAGLSANLDRGAEPTGLGPSLPQTVAELHSFVYDRAAELAGRFDARNGNDYYSTRLSAALTALPAVAALPPASSRPAVPRRPAAVDPQEGEPDASQLMGRAEDLVSGKKFRLAAEAYTSGGAALEGAGRLREAGLAYAEAGQCLALDDDLPASQARFQQAVPLLRAGEAELTSVSAVLAAWAPVAARLGSASEQIDHTSAVLEASADFDAAGLAGDVAAERHRDWLAARAELRDTLARSLAATEDPGQVAIAAQEAGYAASDFAELGLIHDAAHSFWLAGRCQRDLGRISEAIWSLESAFEGFTIGNALNQRGLVANDMVPLLKQTGDHARLATLTSQLTK
ncbi:MAG: hypothetical protein ACK5KO_00740 [Arachnia sp.]